MNQLLIKTFCVLHCFLFITPLVGDEKFTSIFNGKTFDGWVCRPEGQSSNWSIDGGEIIAKGKGRESYLLFKRQLSDFELKFSYKILSDTGNTGVEVRGIPVEGKPSRLQGYHADIGHVGIGDKVLGAWDFHENQRGDYLAKRGQVVIINHDGSKIRHPIDRVFEPESLSKNDWNHVHITAIGNTMWFTINGEMASKVIDNEDAKRLDKGLIGFQLHSGDQMEVAFKNILLKEK